MNRVVAKADDNIPANLVNVLDLFLFIGANQHFIATQHDVGWRPRRARLLFDYALHLLLHDIFHQCLAFIARRRLGLGFIALWSRLGAGRLWIGFSRKARAWSDLTGSQLTAQLA